MKSCKIGKHILCFLGIAVLLAAIAPLIYAVIKVDNTPGLVIDKVRKD